MSQIYTPRPYGALAREHMLAHRRAGLHARMGMGKTVITLDVLDTLLIAGEVERVLVLAPLRVARSTWHEEAAKWDEFKHLRFSIIVGDILERMRATNAPADIYCMNYDNLPWLVRLLGDRWSFDTVVADESVRLKSYRTRQGGIRAQSLAAVAQTKVRRWYNLTGLAAPNGLQDLWGQLWFIDGGRRLGTTYSAFERRWFNTQRAGPVVTSKPMAHAHHEITEKISDVCLALNPKNWFDLKDPVVSNVYVDLPPQARKHYREMEKLLYTELQGVGIEAFAAAGKTIKCLQIANGAAYLPDYIAADEYGPREWAEIHQAKLEALDSIIAEAAGEPILVAYQFRSDLARILKAFPKARHIKGKREEDAFKRGEIQVAVVHPDSIGHGVDGFQHVCNTVVFFGHWWRMESREQLIERVGPMRQMQAGRTAGTFVYNIIARDTVDEDVLARNAGKYSVEEALMQGLNRRKE